MPPRVTASPSGAVTSTESKRGNNSQLQTIDVKNISNKSDHLNTFSPRASVGEKTYNLPQVPIS